MKRIMAAVLAVCMALALSACGKSGAPADDASLKQMLARKALIAGFDNGYAPLGFQTESGAYQGFDLDLAKELSNRLEVTLNLQLLDASDARDKLNGAQVDYLCNNLFLGEQEENAFAKSDPVMKSRVVVAVRMGSGIDSLAALDGKNVGVVPNTRAQTALDGQNDFASRVNVVEQADASAALAALNEGTVDAIVVDEVFARNAEKNGASLIMLDEALASYDYCLLFREEDGTLREKLNALLDEMAADGTLTELSVKWFGADITTRTAANR